ncbi:MAG: iron ABC transporter permease [Pseudomonadota bacterium]
MSALPKSDRKIIFLLAMLSIMSIFLTCFLGPVALPFTDLLAGFVGRGPRTVETIIWDLRFPRALAAFVAGACLGGSGAALQGLLRNPLADPGVLGVSSSAALGAVVALYFNLAVFGLWVMPLAAILAALAATAMLYTLGAARVSTTRLILIGVGVSSFTGAMITLVMNLAPNPFALADLVNWLFGSVSNRSMRDILFVIPFGFVGFVCLMTVVRPLGALSLGEQTAISLGVDLKQVRRRTIAGASLLTGASVALAGAIGFVGIIAPHLCRPFVAHDPGRTIVPAALLAGLMVVIADIIVRLLPFPQELRLGVIAGLVGAPVFVWIAAKTAKLAP